MAAPGRVTLLVGAGLVLLALLTCWTVARLQVGAVEEATAEQGLLFEQHIAETVRRLAEKELSAEGGNLAGFGDRIVAALESHPLLLDLVVVDPRGEVVRIHSRRSAAGIPCVSSVPLDREAEHEHPAGTLAGNPVACRTVPIVRDGRAQGAVLFHAERDFGKNSTRAAAWVERTAWRLAPVFALSYVLLGALLVLASRAVRRWRSRAASWERVQALGAIADGINHEIKNPLNALGLSLQFLARRHADAETREVVETAGREAERIRERLEDFVRFTRVSRLETGPVSLGPRLRERFAGNGRVEVRGEAKAVVDAAKVEGAVTALLEFLAGRCRAGEPVRLTLSQGGGEWTILAEGSACGVEAADVDRFFDPYVRVPPHDVGRGLALARAVFHAHGGDLVARLKGSRLVLRGHAPRVPPGERDR